MTKVTLQWTFEPAENWKLLRHSCSFILLTASCLPAFCHSSILIFFSLCQRVIKTKPSASFVLENFYQKVIVTTLCIYVFLQMLKFCVTFLSPLQVDRSWWMDGGQASATQGTIPKGLLRTRMKRPQSLNKLLEQGCLTMMAMWEKSRDLFCWSHCSLGSACWNSWTHFKDEITEAWPRTHS